jgi:uncharacterized protein YecE (DUF72 family)
LAATPACGAGRIGRRRAYAAASEETRMSSIRVGVGGWTYEPWRDNFYPAGWPHARELAYASQRLSVIEINSTYHGTQKRSSFAKWRDDTPDGFMFTVKASRYATNRGKLAEGGESIERFLNSGIAELGPKLGPLLWQFMPTKRFDPDDFDAFLKLLPRAVEGVPLRHAMEVRHPSFRSSEYLALARRHGVATVFTDSDEYPTFADLTGDFVYARLMRGRSALPTCYALDELDAIAACAKAWAAGAEPVEAPRVEPPQPPGPPRDVFMFFISRAKERAPAGAQALIERL